MTTGDKLAIFAKEGRVVDGKEHTHRRLIYTDTRKRFGSRSIGHRLPNLKGLQPNNGTNIARGDR